MIPDSHRTKRTFRIIDNTVSDQAPYGLVDDTDTVIRVSASRTCLVDLAFAQGADEVRHDEDLVLAESRFP